jgi:hypothetical protein
MTPIFRTWAAAGVAALSMAVLSCGGQAADAPTTPNASPTPVAQATPTPPPPPPTPAPTPDPSGLAPGPVASVKAYLKTVESPARGSQQYREVQKDADGIFVLYVGEYVVIDSTPRNEAGQTCKWKHDPVYSWDNEDDMMDVKSSSDPFFFKFEAAGPGYAEVTSKIDKAESNEVKMRAIVRR